MPDLGWRRVPEARCVDAPKCPERRPYVTCYCPEVRIRAIAGFERQSLKFAQMHNNSRRVHNVAGATAQRKRSQAVDICLRRQAKTRRAGDMVAHVNAES